MFASVYGALTISVLLSLDCSSSRALGQLEESKVPRSDFGRKMMVAVGDLPEKGRSSGSDKTDQPLQPGQVNAKHFIFPDLGFKMDPNTFQEPFKFQRFFKPALGFQSMKGPLDFLAKRTETSQASNRGGEFELPEVHGEADNEENGAVFPIGRRNVDVLRCMLGRVYRPCWQN